MLIHLPTQKCKNIKILPDISGRIVLPGISEIRLDRALFGTADVRGNDRAIQQKKVRICTNLIVPANICLLPNTTKAD